MRMARMTAVVAVGLMLAVAVQASAAPVLTGAVSRKEHGQGVGPIDIDLTAGVPESRSAQLITGADYYGDPINELTILAIFDVDVTLAGNPDDVTSDVGVVSAITLLASSVVEVQITNLPLATQVNLAFPGVTNEGSPSASTLCIAVYPGDYDGINSSGSYRTSFIDFAKVKNAGYLNQLVTTVDRARADFDCSGRPNFTDFVRIKNANLLGKGVHACSPVIGP